MYLNNEGFSFGFAVFFLFCLLILYFFVCVSVSVCQYFFFLSFFLKWRTLTLCVFASAEEVYPAWIETGFHHWSE